MPAKDLHEAIEQLSFWQGDPTATNFSALLYGLIHKADYANKWALRLGFQHEVEAWDLWNACQDPDVFFKMHGCEKEA